VTEDPPALSERDEVSVAYSITSYLLENGLELTKQKYTHPYAIEILERIKGLDRKQLFAYKSQLSEKRMEIPFPKH
jgi:hypothetical protein